MEQSYYDGYLVNFSRKRRQALKTSFVGEPEYQLYVRAGRAIKDVLDFLCAHLQNQGCARMETIKGKRIGPFSREQKKVYAELAKETALQVKDLNSRFLHLILGAYIRHNITRDLTEIEWNHYKRKIKSDVTSTILHYADWSGYRPNTVSATAKIVFDYLETTLMVPRLDNEAKDDFRTSYRAGIHICRYFLVEDKTEKQFTEKASALDKMLNMARKENFADILQDFDFSSKKADRIAVRRFRKACEGRYENLADFLNQSEDRILNASIGVGIKGLSLFKEYIKTKGYRFATWNGKEYE